MKILFINHSAERCGVADYGRRVFDILKPYMDITYCDTKPDFTGYDIALYNYHYATMPDVKFIDKRVKHVVLFHEAHLPSRPDQVINVTELPRPLFENMHLVDMKHEIPVIHSFGFGFPDKDYPRICSLVKEQYSKAIIGFNIPFAQFGDNEGKLAMTEIAKCKEILKDTEIFLHVNSDFMSSYDLLQFLKFSDIILFLYKPSHGRGISSATDYALSVGKPIGISNSEMFRHLPREICVDNTLLKDLTIEPLRKVWEENSNERFVQAIKNALNG